MKPFQAIIFDMDGVIVDSEPLHERAFREVLEEIGYGRSHGIDFPAYYGMSDLVVWRDFMARHRPPQSLEELLARKEEKFTALLQREEPIFDGLPELLAAEPDSGQLTVYFQKPDGSLGAPKTFPTLTGVSDIAVADWDGDGRAEIFLLSTDERQVGVTQLDKN